MDTFWLNTAFYQASQVLGNTGRNPAVGCVLINKNQTYGNIRLKQKKLKLVKKLCHKWIYISECHKYSGLQ